MSDGVLVDLGRSFVAAFQQGIEPPAVLLLGLLDFRFELFESREFGLLDLLPLADGVFPVIQALHHFHGLGFDAGQVGTLAVDLLKQRGIFLVCANAVELFAHLGDVSGTALDIDILFVELGLRLAQFLALGGDAAADRLNFLQLSSNLLFPPFELTADIDNLKFQILKLDQGLELDSHPGTLPLRLMNLSKPSGHYRGIAGYFKRVLRVAAILPPPGQARPSFLALRIYDPRARVCDSLSGPNSDPSPKRKRAGVFQYRGHLRQYPRACAWGSHYAAPAKSVTYPMQPGDRCECSTSFAVPPMIPDMRRVYFDNAATTFPKPPGVAAAMTHYVESIGASAGRGAYREAVESGKLLARTRDQIRSLLGAKPADPVIFCHNGTDALNTALKSILRTGDHVVTTAMDHNSVLRPLSALEQRREISWCAVPVEPRTTLIDPREIAGRITANTRLVAVNHASNVTGALQPIAEIGEICRRRGILFLVDAAQTAGHVPIDFSDLPVDFMALPGHKGLLGPLGTGVLLIRDGLQDRLQSVREGGTGSKSEQPVQPLDLPDLLEAGSHNAVGIAGLSAALDYLEQRGISEIHQQEQQLIQQTLAAFANLDGLALHGPTDSPRRVGVFSICVEGLEPNDLSALLETQFGLLTRSGLHCAPLAHQTIGTEKSGGTTRISFGPFHTPADVDVLLDSLNRVLAQATEFA